MSYREDLERYSPDATAVFNQACAELDVDPDRVEYESDKIKLILIALWRRSEPKATAHE